MTVGDRSLTSVMTALNIPPDLGSEAVRTMCSARIPLAVFDSRGGGGDFRVVDIEDAGLKEVKMQRVDDSRECFTHPESPAVLANLLHSRPVTLRNFGVTTFIMFIQHQMTNVMEQRCHN